MADKSANKPKKGAHLIKKQAKKPEKPAQVIRTEAKQPKKKRRVPIGVKIAVGVVIAAAAGAFGYVYCYPNVFPGAMTRQTPSRTRVRRCTRARMSR